MAKKFKNPSYYRLDFIKENTFNRVWSLRMTRTRVMLVSCAVAAAGAALVWVIMAYTPLRYLLPGTLHGDLRNQYLETALRVDSLEQKARLNDAYLANIAAILSDEIPEDSAKTRAEKQLAITDSLLRASEAERAFLQKYEDEARFNLSVLSPIAAEGMVFSSPISATVEVSDLPGANVGLRLWAAKAAPVSAIYRGSVLGVYSRPDGTSAVTIQHPNDFISIFDGLGDVFVDKGTKLVAGQRIGHTTPGRATTFELWHKGNELNPRDYISL